jgi:hypothetical protein
MKSLILIVVLFISSILFVFLTEDETIYFNDKQFQYILKAIEDIQDLQDQGYEICVMPLDQGHDWNKVMEDFRFIAEVLDLHEEGKRGQCDYTLLITHGKLDKELDDSNSLLKGKTKDLPGDTGWFTTQCRTSDVVRKSEKHLVPYNRENMTNWEEENNVVYSGVKDFSNIDNAYTTTSNLKSYIQKEIKTCESLGCIYEEDYMVSSGFEERLRREKSRLEKKENK